MSLTKDFGLDTPSRKLILLVLSVKDVNNKKEMDIIHLNKVLKYYEHLVEKEEIYFSNFNLGAVSFEIDENIDFLEDVGLIEEVKNNKYKLTNLGKRAVSELKNKISYDEFNYLKLSKIKLNDLPYNELLYFMYKEFPKTQEYSTQMYKLNIMKRNIINNLLKKKKIDENKAQTWLEEEDIIIKKNKNLN